jgi:hypothetical protein
VFLLRLFVGNPGSLLTSLIIEIKGHPVPIDSRYWILSDGPPTGPFDVAEIQAKLASSEFTPEMKFCRVGDHEWLPLANFEAHIASSESTAAVAADVTANADRDPTPASSVLPTRSAAPPLAKPAIGSDVVIGAGVLTTVLLLIGLAIWWLTPLTPRQVVERFVAADTLVELTKYSTMNLHPALRAMVGVDDTPDPADRFELTQDRPAPAGIGGHYVGCSFRFRDPETNVITIGAGYFHLIEVDGWKIEDIYFMAVNGEALETPYSIARNYRTLFPPPATKPTASGTAGKPQPPNQFLIYAIGRAIFNWWKGGGGGKLLAGLALAVLIGIGSLFTKRKPGGGTS